MTEPTFFNVLLLHPLINLLVGIYHILSFVQIPDTLGWSIVGLTVVLRLLMWPLTGAQIKASAQMQKLTPHLNRLREKHKKDPKALQEETMRLYKEHNVNPAAGCLPVLIQLPLIWALYTVLQHVVVTSKDTLVSEVNAIAYAPFLHLQRAWSTDFLWVPLAATPASLMNTLPLVAIAIPIITAVLQFVQTKMLYMDHRTEEQKKKDKEEKKEDFSTALQTQMMYIFPVMIGFFSFTFPVGLSLYWNTFTLFGMIQQYQIVGWGGMEPLVARLRSKISYATKRN
jgi:YidC/Oxa1 family membrane protein insertase